ncbi:growth/differentiation factor 3 [Heterocephalus glaber]|uniref:Growth/differentiation factor 3 n=1 Tax=Heterocephalus glaber TaxID=10181 RepID=A0AAX6S733_HETGA|nr:growth/differentiation factor 3 [Heterocephalus glaber]
MRPPRAAQALGVLLALSMAQALELGERDFLGLLGADPGPHRLQLVPRVLAKIAREREAAAGPAGLARGPCFVPELGAPGDALRALPDQGGHGGRAEEAPGGYLPVLSPSLFYLGPSQPQSREEAG